MRWSKARRLARGGPWSEDKGKGKEAKALPEAKGKEVAPKINDADSKAKDATAKAKDAAANAKDASSTTRDADLKDDPPHAKA